MSNKSNNMLTEEQQAQLDALLEKLDKEGADYEKIVTAQTQKQNKIVLFIGASIMLVGFIIIIKK